MSDKPIVIPRQPSYAARDAVRAAIRALLAEGFNYREAMTTFRGLLLHATLEQAGRSRKKAVALLKISREHLRRYLKRGGELTS